MVNLLILKVNMDNTFMVAGIWFTGFSIFVVGTWIAAELNELERILRSELDSIRLEIQYLEKE